jgi:hypothetical protein
MLVPANHLERLPDRQAVLLGFGAGKIQMRGAGERFGLVLERLPAHLEPGVYPLRIVERAAHELLDFVDLHGE